MNTPGLSSGGAPPATGLNQTNHFPTCLSRSLSLLTCKGNSCQAKPCRCLTKHLTSQQLQREIQPLNMILPLRLRCGPFKEGCTRTGTTWSAANRPPSRSY